MWILIVLFVVGLLVSYFLELKGEQEEWITHSDLLDPNPEKKFELDKLIVGHKNQFRISTQSDLGDMSNSPVFTGDAVVKKLYDQQMGQAGMVATFLTKRGYENSRWYISISYTTDNGTPLDMQHSAFEVRKRLFNRFFQSSLLQLFFCDKSGGAGKVLLEYSAFEDFLKQVLASSFFSCQVLNIKDVRKLLDDDSLRADGLSNKPIVPVYELSIINVKQVGERKVEVFYTTHLSWRKADGVYLNNVFVINTAAVCPKVIKPMVSYVPWKPARNLEYALALLFEKAISYSNTSIFSHQD